MRFPEPRSSHATSARPALSRIPTSSARFSLCRHIHAAPSDDRQLGKDAALRDPAAGHRRRHLLLVLARRLGIVRGASAILLIAGLFLQSASGLFRLRIVVMSIVAVAAACRRHHGRCCRFRGFPNSSPPAPSLPRITTAARLGRFARYGIGFQMAMENPLGIGPLDFGRSWRGHARHLAESAARLWLAGFRLLGDPDRLDDCRRLQAPVPRPAMAAVSALRLCRVSSAISALGTIIDTDHWRHFYLLLGMIWGAIALEYRHQREHRPVNFDAPAWR